MSSIEITVVKRDGTEELFDVDKLSASIMQAAIEVGGENYMLADELASKIEDILETNGIHSVHSEELEKLVEDILIDEKHSSTATAYIAYATKRNQRREMNTELMKEYEDITFSSGEDSDLKRENANINSDTAMGTMLKYGSEGAKKFNLMYLISPDIAKAHKDGDIHIHDLDFFNITETCCQIPLDKLFHKGFNTGHGFLREPGGIRAAGALAAIAIQSDQNDQHKRVA